MQIYLRSNGGIKAYGLQNGFCAVSFFHAILDDTMFTNEVLTQRVKVVKISSPWEIGVA